MTTTALGRLRATTPDALLGACLVAMVAIMVVPLPTWLLDLLLTANLAGSAVLLLLSVFVPSPLRIAGFPSLLLLSTLFRLSLNISSTRLILSQADAGAVIRAFGDFVVRGNYVVGFVVFVLLLVVQFVVIAKGAERIAEVGARFTLDAMPGKQLGIDSQQRMGTLSAAQARRARRALEQEGQFYGAMDGAMKFVKGDVVAGAIIAIVNVVGGLAIGVLQQGYTVGEAMTIYGLLTVGDGFVCQLPALVTAAAAGVLVTRVASEHGDDALGTQLAEQLLATPPALATAAAFVGVLALVPGLPTVPFLLVAAGLATTAAWSFRRAHGRPSGPADADAYGAHVPAMRAWEIRVGGGLAGWTDSRWESDEGRPRGLRQLTEELRTTLFEELGVPLPPCTLRVDSSLPADELQLRVRELPAASGSAPARGREDWLLHLLHPALRAHAAELLGIAETLELLERLRSASPTLVEQVATDARSVARLTRVLQLLLVECVSVRDLPTILAAISRASEKSTDIAMLVAAARRDLGPALAHLVADADGTIRVVTLAPEIEESLRASLVATSDGHVLALPSTLRRELSSALQHALGSAKAVLAASDLRVHVRDLLSTASLDAHVVSADEIPAQRNIQRVGQVDVPGL